MINSANAARSSGMITTTSLVGQHILSCDQFDLSLLAALFRVADILTPVAQGKMIARVLEGAVLGSLFFEASTRTRLSFDSAFMRLGGSVSHTTGVSFSSIVKGETIADTSRVISGYVDAFVVRHPEEEAIHQFASSTNVPVINGGNGAGEHPTQALLDIYTIKKEFQRIGREIDGSRVAMIGDLKYGRTVHSLVKLLSLFRKMTFVFVAPRGLEMPPALVDLAVKRGHSVEASERVADGLRDAHIVYATRVQKERFPEAEQPVGYNSDFRIGKVSVDRWCSPSTVIMHPLPRDGRPGANDLSDDLNGDPRLAIFRQTDAGVPIRMALFAMVMNVESQIEKSLRPANWWRPAKIGPWDADFR